ncbi:hypothetical protein [Spirillospora sp. NPDC047279]|uniref:hypothetical protein n=1 Tax=Spirillospora sp. NPDC047279 TaxID=3155478 RepID=UPI0033DD42FD
MVRSDGSRGDLRPYGPIGNAGDVPVAGDWNGDCVDSIGLYRPANSRFYLIWAPNVIQDIPYGTPNQDKPIIGDWDSDDGDEVGVYRPANRTFYLHS